MRILLASILFFGCNVNQEDPTPVQNTPRPLAANEQKISNVFIAAYPGIVTGFSENNLVFEDGSKMIYDDEISNKDFRQLLNNPDVQDQLHFDYPAGMIPKSIERNFDPGRIRNENFFKKIYGSTEEEVENNLTEITWCPKLSGQKLKISRVNGASKALQKVSDELDGHPELQKYLSNVGGTFNWRYINGTSRLSNHSFGITIDISTRYSDYWQWDCNCTDEAVLVKYKNRIPQLIVDVFEKNGFIWGGKWYHFDTMHFEYRPELLIGDSSYKNNQGSKN